MMFLAGGNDEFSLSHVTSLVLIKALVRMSRIRLQKNPQYRYELL